MRALPATLCLAAAALLAAPTCTAQGNIFSIGDVIATAKAKYPAIKAAQAQQRAAKEAVGVARAAYLPRTDLLWQTNRATANNIYALLLPQSVIPSVTGPVIAADVTRSAWNTGGGALFSWQPFDFGARAARVKAAQEGSEAAQKATVVTMLEVTASAGSAFFDLAAAQQLVKASQANVRRTEAFQQAVHVLVDNTLRPGADASQADAQVALARDQLIQSETQEAVRRATLAEYLQSDGSPFTIDAAPLLSGLPASDLDAAEATNHPSVLEESALTLEQEAKKRQLDRSYAPVFSTMGAVSGRGAGTALNGVFPGGTAGLAPDTLNWIAGIQVSFAAFDYFSLRSQQKAQAADVDAEYARYQQSLSDVSAAMEAAQASLAGARKMAENTPHELAAAQASEQQQQARYRSSLATVVDVAAAEGVLAQAEADDAIARLGVWRAELALAAAQGDLQPFLQLLQAKGK